MNAEELVSIFMNLLDSYLDARLNYEKSKEYWRDEPEIGYYTGREHHDMIGIRKELEECLRKLIDS